ncbi:MAG TPA: nitroreductase/quinone reductase family protein [Pseudonocardia sp.]|jgi:deazaflavin-dependent oxidoreductase (nitroreductase family)|nr:nitroreductase/quinone reductase family protein [Pseudonocardia sp.]
MTEPASAPTSERLWAMADDVASTTGPGQVTRDYNRDLVSHYRQHGGKLPPGVDEMPVILIGMTSARSGKKRTVPLLFIDVGPLTYIAATRGGTSVNPLWFDDLVANPGIRVECGDSVYDATAVVLEGAERDKIWAEFEKQIPLFQQYQAGTDRVIPVIELRPT